MKNRFSLLHRRSLSDLWSLGSVKRSTLFAILDTRRIESAANNMIADARQVLHATSPDEDDRVLLQIVANSGIYVVTSIPLLRRTLVTFRRAEFGFFGVVVYTRMQTPRRCGQDCSAGVLAFLTAATRPLRTN